MRRLSVEEAHHYLARYSDGACGATRSDNGRVRIIDPGYNIEVDENEVTAVKLTAYLYLWRIRKQNPCCCQPPSHLNSATEAANLVDPCLATPSWLSPRKQPCLEPSTAAMLHDGVPSMTPTLKGVVN